MSNLSRPFRDQWRVCFHHHPLSQTTAAPPYDGEAHRRQATERTGAPTTHREGSTQRGWRQRLTRSILTGDYYTKTRDHVRGGLVTTVEIRRGIHWRPGRPWHPRHRIHVLHALMYYICSLYVPFSLSLFMWPWQQTLSSRFARQSMMVCGARAWAIWMKEGEGRRWFFGFYT